MGGEREKDTFLDPPMPKDERPRSLGRPDPGSIGTTAQLSTSVAGWKDPGILLSLSLSTSVRRHAPLEMGRDGS